MATVIRSCSYRVSVHCETKAPASRKRCKQCGGALSVRTVRFGVFEWTGTGRYPAENALRIFERETPAQRYIDTTEHDSVNGGWVIREVAA